MHSSTVLCSLRAVARKHTALDRNHIFLQPQVVALADGSVDSEADHNCLITSHICILLMAIFLPIRCAKRRAHLSASAGTFSRLMSQTAKKHARNMKDSFKKALRLLEDLSITTKQNPAERREVDDELTDGHTHTVL